MPTLSDAKARLWKAAKPRSIKLNPDSAIYKFWDAHRVEERLGVPLGNELVLDDGTAVQEFSSGVLLHWAGGDVVRIE